jgi:hypothetical protein
MSGRIFVTTLGYNRAEMVEDCFRNLSATTLLSEQDRLVKTLCILGYPLPSPEQNRIELLDIAEQFGFSVVEFPNVGVMQNWNTVIHEHLKMQTGDYLLTWDPDVRMQQPGFLSAMVEALESDPDNVYVCAARPYHDEEWCSKQHGREIYTLPSGSRVARYRDLIAWSVGMFKAEFLNTRPRDFKATGEVYGWCEHADVRRMKLLKKKWVSLVDHYDHHLGAMDESYTLWKIESAQTKTTDTFDVWLRKRQ